jgi:hypothetical protein
MRYEYAPSWDLPSVAAADAVILGGRGQYAQAPPYVSASGQKSNSASPLKDFKLLGQRSQGQR